MRAIILTLVGAVALLGSMLAVAVAMSPQECDALAGWIYSQAESRDTGVRTLDQHEQAVREANAAADPDLVELLIRELRKVYKDKQEPIAAAMDGRFECYKRRGEIGVGVKETQT